VLGFAIFMVAFGGGIFAMAVILLRRNLEEKVRAKWVRILTKEHVLTPGDNSSQEAIDDLILSQRRLSGLSILFTGVSIIIAGLLALILVRVFWGRIIGADDTATIPYEVLL